ncbi:MAG: hypothetical protein HQL28_03725 [Candidatus Omnitrophica bacterium]|nr:hypothetical protein [Candidatus Omnitrophota bacterium]
MNKKPILLAVLIILLLIGIIIAVSLSLMFLKFEPKITYNVKVKTIEGSVNIYEIVEGNKGKLVKTVNAGEEFTVTTTLGGGLALDFNFLRPIVPKAAEIYCDKMELFTSSVKEDYFKRLFTEKELADQIIPQLDKTGMIKNITVSIDTNGFSGSADVTIAGKTMPFKFSGIVYLDKTKANNLALNIKELKLGSFNMPNFMNNQLISSFGEIFSKTSVPITIEEMSYQKGGIEITFRKKRTRAR